MTNESDYVLELRTVDGEWIFRADYDHLRDALAAMTRETEIHPTSRHRVVRREVVASSYNDPADHRL